LDLSELTDDEALLEGGQNRLGHRGLEEAGLLSRGDRHLAEDGGGSDLPGHGHDDEVAAVLVLSLRADDDGWPFLGAGLVGEREGKEDDVADPMAGRRRHRGDCPRPS
jgi:hypothetical protein